MRYLTLNTDFVICYLMFGLLVSVGCTAKSYVRHEGVPLIKMVSDVNERTTARMNEIAILDAHVQHGAHALDSAAENATEGLINLSKPSALLLSRTSK